MFNSEIICREIDFPFIGKHPVVFHTTTGRLMFYRCDVPNSFKPYHLTKEQKVVLDSFVERKKKEFLASRRYKGRPCWKRIHIPKFNLDVMVYFDEYGEPRISTQDIAKGLQMTSKEAKLWCNLHGFNTCY